MGGSLKTFVSDFLVHLGVEVSSVEVEEGLAPPEAGRGGRTVVRVASSDSAKLIGPHGEHLRAINTIARRLWETKEGEVAAPAAGFLIDVNGYHEEQLEKIRQNARMLAQRARLFKRDVELEPMSAYERLVVHELFAHDPEIKTESMGEGKFRRVVLRYKDAGFVS